VYRDITPGKNSKSNIPWFRKLYSLDSPSSWSTFALLHSHQIANISKNCFQISHVAENFEYLPMWLISLNLI